LIDAPGAIGEGELGEGEGKGKRRRRAFLAQFEPALATFGHTHRGGAFCRHDGADERRLKLELEITASLAVQDSLQEMETLADMLNGLDMRRAPRRTHACP